MSSGSQDGVRTYTRLLVFAGGESPERVLNLWEPQWPSPTPENGFHDGWQVSGTAVPAIAGGIGKNTRTSRQASSCHLLPAACVSGTWGPAEALWMGSYLERWAAPCAVGRSALPLPSALILRREMPASWGLGLSSPTHGPSSSSTVSWEVVQRP